MTGHKLFLCFILFLGIGDFAATAQKMQPLVIQCDIDGPGTINPTDYATFSLVGTCQNTATNWITSCGYIDHSDNNSVTVNVNQSCATITISAYNGSALIKSKTFTITQPPTLVPGAINNASQTINYGSVPALLSTSAASGGYCPSGFAYTWYSSTDNATWSYAGGNGQDFQPAGLNTTTYFKRYVTCGLQTAYTNAATVTVLPQVVPGNVSPSTQTINYNTVAQQLSLSNYSGGNNTYSFQWQSLSGGGSWTNVGTNVPNYTTGPLTSTTNFRVAVSSNSSTPVYSDVATVTVLPPLVAGTLSPANQSVNYNSVPGSALSVGGTSGGNGVYSYQWWSNDGSGYQVVNGATGSSFTPGPLIASTSYKVLVSSNGASQWTNEVVINVYPQLVIGTLAPASQTINYSGTGGQLSLSSISGGNGVYTYQWYTDASGSYQPISGATASNFTPSGLTSSAHFKVVSTSNGVSLTSNEVLVSVYPQMASGIISPASQSVDPGTTAASLTFSGSSGGSGVYSYQWYTDASGSYQPILGATGSTYSPGLLSSTTHFYVVTTSNGATVTSSPAVVSVIDMNYIKTRLISKPGITDYINATNLTNATDVQQTTIYYDGLGRVVQTVSRQASPKAKDIVAPQVYDDFGRESTHLLPYVSDASDGNYKPDFLSEQNSFSNSQFPNEQVYYGQTNFELSPLDRPLAAYSAGASWIGASRGIQTDYLLNTEDEGVRIWNIDTTSGSLPVSPAVYGDGLLVKTMTTDEQGHQTVEYKDKEGHIILKKVKEAEVPGIDHTGWLCTYYIYDDLDNLRFVMAPKAVNMIASAAWVVSQGIADELCFQYAFDDRKRMVMKKVPGAAEVWMVYDTRDRLVFTQDGNQRVQNTWISTQYDGLNRPVLVGQMNYASSRIGLQQTVNNQMSGGTIAPLVAADLYLSTPDLEGDNVATELVDMQDGFSTLVNGDCSISIVSPGSVTSGYPSGGLPISLNPVPTGATVQPLIINYYDNYDWVAATGSGLGTTFANDKTNYFITGYNAFPEYAVPVTATTQVKGMTTGSMHLVLGENRPLYAVNFYDDRNRLIQTRAMNYTGAIDTVTSQYDFTGKVLRNLLTHYKAGNGAQYHTVLTKMDYDFAFRPLHIWKNIDGASADQLISSLQYNELGQLVNKTLGNSLDNLNYTYNIRGWLSSINQDYISSTSAAPLHYFGLQLGYDKSQAGPTGTSFRNLQFSGNISGCIWKSAGDGVNRQYDFTYDNANRLTGADFNQQFAGGWGKTDPANSVNSMDFSVTNLAYDPNGNILRMDQQGWMLGGSKLIDNLTYAYNSDGASNKLLAVTEGTTIGTTDNKLGDFTDKNPTLDDYSYDSNGNLIIDKNKGISSIEYNYLNLPQKITFDGKGTISYTYDAAGVKLKKTTVDNIAAVSKTTTTSYIGGMQYQNDSLLFMGHEEGRARWALHYYTGGSSGYGWEYDFFEKDHLGNTRIVLTQQKDTAQYFASMEAAYRAKEMALFYNIDSTSYPTSSVPGGFPDDGPPTPNDSVARVSGTPGSHKMGPAILLKVMSGDSIAFGVKSFYRSNASPGSNHSALQDVLGSLAQGLLSIAGAGHATMAELNNTSGSPVYAALNSFLPAKDPDPTGKPKAYLNWMLLDNQFNYVEDQSGAQQVGDPDILKTLAQPLKLHHSGYLYIWVSNETENWEVFFDNLSVNHYSGPMIEEAHYYPFGLTIAGISDRALKQNYKENKFKYNGKELENQEFNDGSGLEWYDYGARMLDVQIGRWSVIDGLAEKAKNYSTYSYAFNNPERLIDVAGRFPEEPDKGGAVGLSALLKTLKQNNVHDLGTFSSFFGGVSQLGSQNTLTDLAKQNRYVYSLRWGWIDLKHVASAANLTDALYITAHRVLKRGEDTEDDQERKDIKSWNVSAWSYEDLASNLIGAYFEDWLEGDEADKAGSFLDQLGLFLSELGVVEMPEVAPNYADLPASSKIAESEDPKDVEKNTSYLPRHVYQWIDRKIDEDIKKFLKRVMNTQIEDDRRKQYHKENENGK